MNGVDVVVHQSSSFIGRTKFACITWSPSVAVVSEIAPRWMIAWSLRPCSQRSSSRRRHEVGELPLGEIAPLAVVAEVVADGHIRPARVVQRGDHVRSDKPGPAGHQQHAPLKSLNLRRRPLPQTRPAGNLCPKTW